MWNRCTRMRQTGSCWTLYYSQFPKGRVPQWCKYLMEVWGTFKGIVHQKRTFCYQSSLHVIWTTFMTPFALFVISFGILQKKISHTGLKKYCMMNDDFLMMNYPFKTLLTGNWITIENTFYHLPGYDRLQGSFFRYCSVNSIQKELTKSAKNVT